jgi:hypothetical protein
MIVIQHHVEPVPRRAMQLYRAPHGCMYVHTSVAKYAQQCMYIHDIISS